MKPNPIIAKVKKLLALAADQEGKPEGDLAAKFADRLMREHAISQGDVEGLSFEDDPMVVGGTVNTGQARWKVELAHAIGKHCNVECLYNRGNKGRRAKYLGASTGGMKAYGRKSDIEILNYLFVLCFRQIDKAAKEWGDGWAGRIELTDFRMSAIRGLNQRLRDIRAAGEAAMPMSTALVVQRYTLAKQAAAPFRRGHMSGVRRMQVAEGYEAGKNITLHDAINSRPAPEALRLS